MRMRSLFVRQR